MAEPQNSTETKALELAQEAVMVKSVPVAAGTPIVKGYDFNTGRDLDGIMAAAMTTGFQVHRLVQVVSRFWNDVRGYCFSLGSARVLQLLLLSVDCILPRAKCNGYIR